MTMNHAVKGTWITKGMILVDNNCVCLICLGGKEVAHAYA